MGKSGSLSELETKYFKLKTDDTLTANQKTEKWNTSTSFLFKEIDTDDVGKEIHTSISKKVGKIPYQIIQFF